MIYVLSIVIIVAVCLFIWAAYDSRKRSKKWWTEHDHTKATKKKRYRITPDSGIRTFVINPHKWVIIEWNKSENILNVWEPKHTYKTPEEYKLGKGSLNWRIREVAKVDIKEYFKRTRIR